MLPSPTFLNSNSIVIFNENIYNGYSMVCILQYLSLSSIATESGGMLEIKY